MTEYAKPPPTLFAEFDPSTITSIPGEYLSLYGLTRDIQGFGVAMRPAIEQLMATVPVEFVRVGRLWTNNRRAVHDVWLGQFTTHMNALDPEKGVPRWQLYVDRRPEHDQSYPLWFLEELFNFIRPPGFNI